MGEQPLKTRYTAVELQEFSDIIDQKIDEANRQLSFYLDQLAESANHADSKIKGLEDGINASQNEKIATLAARSRKYIQHLENAKHRIQNKVYGICRETGKLISKERLRAVPHATLSIEAKNKKQ